MKATSFLEGMNMNVTRVGVPPSSADSRSFILESAIEGGYCGAIRQLSGPISECPARALQEWRSRGRLTYERRRSRIQRPYARAVRRSLSRDWLRHRESSRHPDRSRLRIHGNDHS